MWFFYIFALIPILVGAFFLWRNNQVTWGEWLIGSIAAFIVAMILHISAIYGMATDVETWSGRITKVSHYPRWVERYEKCHSETYKDSNGKSHTRSWTTTEYDTHPEHWTATRDFGSYSDETKIKSHLFNEISHQFGGQTVNDGQQSTDHFGGTFSSGDNNIYSYYNKTGYVYPITTIRRFENRIKAAPTVFSFSKVPTNIAVFPWPNNPDWLHSNRLLGTSTGVVSRYKWDCMNTALGYRKRVNVILVGFGDVSSDLGHYQQAKWLGGKKNDLVICFGGATRTNPPKWTYVFGWTESELVKKNIQSLLLNQPINDDIIPLISEEIMNNYIIKDWKKFDYITIDPPAWSYWVYFISMILTQSGLYLFFHKNDYDKLAVRWSSSGRNLHV
jgi:hypothetical protein